MSAVGANKKSRFSSLVSQTSLSKLPKKDMEGSMKGMMVFSVESVYCDVENSDDVFDGQRNSKFKTSESSGASKSNVKDESSCDRVSGMSIVSSGEKPERSTRKKFRGDSSGASLKGVDDRGADTSKTDVCSSMVCDKNFVSKDSERYGREFTKREKYKREDEKRERHASDDVTDGSDMKAKNRTLRSERSKPIARSVECSSGDSCFVDRGNEVAEVARPSREHSRHQRKHGAERSGKRLPSSSFLQPPRIHFRSRSAQKSLSRAEPRQSQSSQTDPRPSLPGNETERKGRVVDPSSDGWNGSAERRSRRGSNSRQTRGVSDFKSNVKSDFDAVVSSEQSCSDSFEQELVLGIHDLHHDNSGSAVVPLISSARMEKDGGGSFRDLDVDSVFYGGDYGAKKLTRVGDLRRRSVSVGSLFQRVRRPKFRGMNERPEEIRGQGYPQFPFKSLHLSLHSLRSPNRTERFYQFDELPHSRRLSSSDAVQKKSNANVIRNFFSEIQHHLELRSSSGSPKNSGERRNTIKKLMHTCSSGSCFCRDNLSSPSSREAFGSLSYESSV